jgi:hypothetical protein
MGGPGPDAIGGRSFRANLALQGFNQVGWNLLDMFGAEGDPGRERRLEPHTAGGRVPESAFDPAMEQAAEHHGEGDPDRDANQKNDGEAGTEPPIGRLARDHHHRPEDKVKAVTAVTAIAQRGQQPPTADRLVRPFQREKQQRKQKRRQVSLVIPLLKLTRPRNGLKPP